MIIYDEQGKLNADVEDALSELGNVGVGMATVALGKILGMRVVIKPPSVASAEQVITDTLGLHPEQEAVGILMTMEQALKGMVLFIMERRFIEDAVRTMTGRDFPGISLIEDEDSLSAMQELANIMAASCMKAIADYARLRIYLSPVMVGVDMVGALVSFPIAQYEWNSEKVVCVDTRFSLTDAAGNITQDAGHILIMPDESSVQLMMDALGIG